MKILMIRRAEQFSPNAVENDRAILEAVALRLSSRGHQVTQVDETLLASSLAADKPDFIFSMARLPASLRLLEASGLRVINAPQGVSQCSRRQVQAFMASLHIPYPAGSGPHGYWLKRADAAAQTADDVGYAPDLQALASAKAAMRARGIHDYLVSPHVEGDLVKFYGVSTTGFFRYYYPTDDGLSKFGLEQLNGQAHHYPFSATDLQTKAEALAAAVGLQIYGGDCIVTNDGSWYMIDFNDWPSFSRCREEAAEAIARLI
jgi:hypothetical protein